MATEHRRVVFHHALGDAVYLEDSPGALHVVGYQYTAWATVDEDQDLAEALHDGGIESTAARREQRTYLLKPPQGRAFWIEERHIRTAPSRTP